MQCFENFIGVRGLCLDKAAPTSGLYLNDLEGISLAAAARSANEEQGTGLRLLEEKIATAVRLTGEDLLQRLYAAGYHRYRAELENHVWGNFTETALPPNPTPRGLRIRVTGKRRLVKLVIKRITVTAVNKTPVVVTVTDGANIAAFTIQAEAGQPSSVFPNYVLLNDAATLTVADAELWQTQLGGGACGCTGGSASAYYKAEGWNGARAATQSFGLQAEIAAVCHDEELLCALRDRLATPVLYRAGIETLRERRFTDRANTLTLQKELAEQLEADWQKIYEQKLLDLSRQLPEFLQSLNSPCLVCTGAKSAFSRL